MSDMRPSLSIGTPIDIQYEVFRKNVAPELHWYRGVVSALSLLTDSSIQVTVRFQGSESFPECDESFILGYDNQLTRKGKVFPFKLEANHTNATTTNIDPTIVPQPVRHIPSTSETERLLLIEQRLSKIEEMLSCSHPPALYTTLCSLLNTSLRRYKSRKQKFLGTSEDITNCTWKLCQTCTYSDFKEFTKYLKSIDPDLQTEGNDESTTAPSRVILSVHSFRTFCRLFGIAEFNYKSLLSCPKFNRKGILLSFKCIGSFIDNKSEPALPSLLCVGGDPRRWNDDNSFFYKENSHTLNSGSAVCSFQRLTTQQRHGDLEAKLGSLTGSTIVLKWTLDDSTDICRPLQSDSTFIGKMEISLPYVNFHKVNVATKVQKWLSPNRTISYSSDSSTSSSS